jgi:hypothetical protein
MGSKGRTDSKWKVKPFQMLKKNESSELRTDPE